MLKLAAVDLAASLQTALDGLLGFLLNLLGFLAILIVGYFIARIVKGIAGKSSSAWASTRRCTAAMSAST